MPAEWKDIWTLAFQVVARQPPPLQIFFWLCVAFAVLMFVEGLRASFLPRGSREGTGGHETRHAGQTSSSSTFAAPNPETVFVRAQRRNTTRNRRLATDAPRRHQAFRPKIRRVSSSFEPALTASSEQLVRYDSQAPVFGASDP